MTGINSRVPQEVAGRSRDTDPKFPLTNVTKQE